ncbi:hypothetical protein LCGC14_1122530 [marine sediment metagenome]|uniref:Uncharacterized protein n=1 Tax=marine sediment metagenome TaxID=412755 RepID=A0A0F9M8A7_9ZZZZ
MTAKEKAVQIALGTLKKYHARYVIEIIIDEFEATSDEEAQEIVSKKFGAILPLSPNHLGIDEGIDWDHYEHCEETGLFDEDDNEVR